MFKYVESSSYHTDQHVQGSQAHGAFDCEEGHLGEPESSWSRAQILAYWHGWSTGHVKCDCVVRDVDGSVLHLNELSDPTA